MAKTAFGFEIHQADDLVRAEPTLLRYDQIILSQPAAYQLVSNPKLSAMLKGKSLLINLELAVDAVDEEVMDWLFKQPVEHDNQLLVSITEKSLESFVRDVGNAGIGEFGDWLAQRIVDLSAATGLAMVFENRVGSEMFGLAPAEIFGALARQSRNRTDLSFSIDLDALLQVRLGLGQELDAVLPQEFLNKCTTVSVKTPFPQQVVYENLGLTLSNYPREIWSVLADLVKALKSDHEPITLNLRRAPQDADDQDQAVLRWANIFLNGLSASV